MKYTLTRRLYYADLAAVPLLIAALAFGWYVLAALAGFALWSIFEYVTHRFAFHHLAFRAAHAYHHAVPAAYVGAHPGIFLIALPALALPPFYVALAAGFLAGYLLYLFAHDTFHHTEVQPSSWLYAAARRHAEHHGGKPYYNITFPIVDLIVRGELWGSSASWMRRRIPSNIWMPRSQRPRSVDGNTGPINP